ncbi:hypothetical protein [Peribacillus frigoritolerans]|uniref:hypothetical protein n=1 Tax=Peribacillus frigoritolerans TaxID=450367 RepID=UPI003F52DC15
MRQHTNAVVATQRAQVKLIAYKKLVFHEKVEELSKLRFLMDKKNGTIKFHDIVRIEGKKQFRDKINKDLIEEESQKLKIEKRVSELQKAKRKLSNPKEIKNIINAYQQYIKTFMDELNLPKVDIKKYSNINANIKEKGNNQPRALLAYYYSVLNVNYIYSNSTFCPIVIDSPNQQDRGVNCTPIVRHI